MKREDAVTLLREISVNCQNVSPDTILLLKAQPDDHLSVGYQLHIRMALDPITAAQIRLITLKNCLAVYEEKGEAIIIYKPKP
jgi:hypothetical protein